MLVVREQDHVDSAEIGGAAVGRGRLGQHDGRGLVVAGAVERGVGEKAQAAVVEEGGRATEYADGDEGDGKGGGSPPTPPTC